MTIMLPGSVHDVEQILEWGSGPLRVAIAHSSETTPRLIAVWNTAEGDPDLPALRRSALPVFEAALVDSGREGTSGKRHVDGALSQRMRLVAHSADRDDDVSTLRLNLVEEATGVHATVFLQVADDIPVLRSWATVDASTRRDLSYATTAALSGLGHGAAWEDQLAVWESANPWSGEFRWRRSTLAERGLYDVGMTRYGQVGSKNRIALTSTGAWSTSEHLPQGIVEDTRTGRMVAWQVESSAGWHAELGDRFGDVYLAAFGPTALEHQWIGRLGLGQPITTAPVNLVVVPGHPDGREATLGEVAAALIRHRRRSRRAHEDHVLLPVVYNDFLNGLMSDPTAEREIPLIDAAADLGAEYYVIDAGWYDDELGGWWDSVGEWEPSSVRFPDGGLGAIIDRIRDHGMTPGLWLEPEVIGVRSRIAGALPDAAFFQRDGVRATEWGRHQLDFRNAEARAHLDSVVDRIVREFGLGYLKLDYNVDIGAGTDGGAGEPVGIGLEGHARAYLDWVRGVMDRHPHLVIEGCAAGGSRSDGATASIFPVQSLTDQQDFLSVPSIATAAAMSLPPEQQGVWASLDQTMTREELAYSMTSAMLGRVHLAGRPDTLNEDSRAVVRDAMRVYRSIRGAIPRAVPVWPLGLPGWRDPWFAYGIRDGDILYLGVWRRGTGATQRFTLPGLRVVGDVDIIFPTWGGEACQVLDGGLTLEVSLPGPVSARLMRLRVEER